MSAAAAAAPVAVISRRAHALAVVPGMADAALVGLCAKLQASLAVVRALDADPATTNVTMIEHCGQQDGILIETAKTPARTRAGRHAKAALAEDVLRLDTMEFLNGKVVMDLLEGLARDVLAEGVA